MINKFLDKTGLTTKLTRAQLAKFIERHRSDGYTLDIGCANSPYAVFFPNRVGLDIKEGSGVDVIGDVNHLPFEDNKFDNVLCTEVLEHLRTPQQALAEIKRVLKPSGHLILSTRFIFPIHDAPDDFYRFTKYGLQNLFTDGWEILELIEETDTKNTLAVLLQRIAYQTKFKWGLLGLTLKALFFIAARIIIFLPSLIDQEFGNISRSTKEQNILTSGYYLFCRKK